MKKTTLTTLFSFFVFTHSTLVWGQSVDSTFSTTSSTSLTDEQAKEANEFIHQGVKDAAIEKGCADLDKCDPGAATSKGVIMPAGLEDNIGRLYVLFFGGTSLLSGGPKVKLNAPAQTSTTTTTATEAPAQKTEANDYCLYGAMGYELVAGMLQMSQQNKAQSESANLKDPQLQALVNLKETHKARKRTATYQSAVYGATSACYVARKVMQPQIAMDWKYITKMTAAAGLATLYVAKAKKHGDAEKKVQAVIDSLPKAGDCNPWTGTACFCNHKTSESLYPSQYQEICVLNAGNADGPLANLGCAANASGKLSYDPSCKCKATNTCYATSVGVSNPTITTGANFMNDANNGYALLDPSKFDSAKLNDYSIGSAGRISNVKAKVTGPIPSSNLSEEQKKIAESLAGVVPPAVASAAAMNSPSDISSGGLMGTSTQSALDKLPTNLKRQIGPSEVSGNYRSSGQGVTDISSGSDSGFVMPPLPGQEKISAGGTEVVNFTEQAFSQADVSKNQDTPIFDIISNRYRNTGWRKLENAE